MEEKVAMITGAGAGIGKDIAAGLARVGCRLALCSRSDGSERTAAELRAEGYDAYAVRADVREPADIARFVSDTVTRFGRVDILVNNAAVNRSGPARTMSVDQFEDIFATNVRGVFFAIQAVIEEMASRGGGRIVNVASFVGRSPVPLFTAYSASKAAVLSLTRGLALELAELDITVNAVCPGNVWSDIWTSSTESATQVTGKSPTELFRDAIEQQPIKRPQTGEEIAAATVFLCSEQARNVTGEAIFVSGGL